MKLSELNAIMQNADNNAYKLLSASLEQETEQLKESGLSENEIPAAIAKLVASVVDGQRRYTLQVIADVLIQCGVVEIDGSNVVNCGDNSPANIDQEG